MVPTDRPPVDMDREPPSAVNDASGEARNVSGARGSRQPAVYFGIQTRQSRAGVEFSVETANSRNPYTRARLGATTFRCAVCAKRHGIELSSSVREGGENPPRSRRRNRFRVVQRLRLQSPFNGSHWRPRAGKVLETPLTRNLKSEDLPKRRVSARTPPSVPGWSAFRTGRELPEDPCWVVRSRPWRPVLRGSQ